MIETIDTEEKISVKLEVFEGPLELLLHLLKRNKVSIYDIPSATFIAVWDGIPRADYYVHYYDELNGNDWSKHIKIKVDEDRKFDEEFGRWLFEDKEIDKNISIDISEYLGFKKE